MRPFFIVGSGRCGTTLLRSMLVQSHEVVIPPESNFIPEAIRRWPFYSHNLDLFVEMLAPQLEQMEVSRSEVRRRLMDRPYTLRNAIAVPFEIAHGDDDIRGSWFAWGDQTPSYIYAMGAIRAVFGEAQFVHLVRDGRDVALSYMDMPFGPKTILGNARRWRRRVRAGREYEFGHELVEEMRYLEVRYEDLVLRPATALSRVCAFLEVPYTPAMLDYRGVHLTEQEEAIHGNLRTYLSPKRDWRTEMSWLQRTLFEMVAWEELRMFGYECHIRGRWFRALVEAWFSVYDGVLMTLADYQVARRLRGKRSVPIERIWRKVNR